MTTRMLYMDDSGSVDTGYIVYGWVEIDAALWSVALRYWLDFRKLLYQDTRIPADTELHCSQFLQGRGNPSLDPGWNRQKANRRAVVEQALGVIATMPGSRVGAVYRQTAKTGRDYHVERQAVYADLIARIDGELAASGDHGLIVMDGTDPAYQREHRKLKLATRRIIEDPWMVGSHTSQPVQAADVVAYTAYQGIQRHPGKQFMWTWWSTHLPHAAISAI